MALAAIEAVPKDEIRLSMVILPSWNRLFSSAEGMPIYKMFFAIWGCRCLTPSQVTRATLSCRVVSFRMMTAPSTRETSVGTATPATPMRSTKMQNALPTILVMFMITDTRMDTSLLPTERKMAAPALYSAKNG